MRGDQEMSNAFISPEDGWKEISTESSGTFSLTGGGQHCVYEGAPPVSLVGHRYVGKPVKFTTGVTESLYARVSRPCFAVGDVEGIDPPIDPPVTGNYPWRTTFGWSI